MGHLSPCCKYPPQDETEHPQGARGPMLSVFSQVLAGTVAGVASIVVGQVRVRGRARVRGPESGYFARTGWGGAEKQAVSPGARSGPGVPPVLPGIRSLRVRCCPHRVPPTHSMAAGEGWCMQGRLGFALKCTCCPRCHRTAQLLGRKDGVRGRWLAHVLLACSPRAAPHPITRSEYVRML
jgi:hypothetical protein